MKIAIVYFSGTGNTLAIAKGYEKALNALGHEVRLTPIDKHTSVEDHDCIIVGGPIYAGNMPDELINWIRKYLPKGIGKKAVVYSTSAGLENAHGKEVCHR